MTVVNWKGGSKSPVVNIRGYTRNYTLRFGQLLISLLSMEDGSTLPFKASRAHISNSSFFHFRLEVCNDNKAKMV